ncbi:MAG TPA: RIP metalloprotease [Actinomycetota bacterium]|nr:RIP metalloprotease [Actinomycetota bacterium]
MSLGVLLFIFAILTVVMIHETGHFIVAKLFGFKATKFFVGFGPTVWSFRRGETEYGIKAIPAGGFVKIIGMSPYEEVPPEDQPRSYPNKPKWQRAILLAAGSATHWVLAFVVLTIASMAIGFPTDRATNEVQYVDPRIEGQPSAAVAAGLEVGDRIVAIDGRAVDRWDPILNFIRSNPGETATFTVARDGELVELDVALGKVIVDAEERRLAYAPPNGQLRSLRSGERVIGYLGVGPQLFFDRKDLFGALGEAGRYTWDLTGDLFTQIDDVFTPVFDGRLWSALSGEGERDLEGPVGAVGIGRIAGQAVQQGNILGFLGLIVQLTIFVGIMNLLPLPPLDGGHLAVLAYEGLTGRTVDVRKLIPLAAIVISFFVLLFLAILYLDLARPLRSPF